MTAESVVTQGEIQLKGQRITFTAFIATRPKQLNIVCFLDIDNNCSNDKLI